MHFKKDMGLLHVLSLAVGSIIGWGCFILPGTSFLPKAGPLGTFLGLLIGGILVSIIGISYGYLIQKYPESGGEFVYAYKNMGRARGFLCGWFLLLAYVSIIPLNVTAVAMVARYILGDLLQAGYLYTVAGYEVFLGEVVLSLCILVLFAYLNTRRVKSVGYFQTVIVVFLATSILVLVSLMFTTNVDSVANLTPAFPTGKSSVSAIIAIVALTPFCFSGFDCIPQASEEFKFSPRWTKILVPLSIFLAVIFYTSMTMVAASAHPWEAFIAAANNWHTGSAVADVLGLGGTLLLTVGISAAIVSGINGFFLSGSRLMYSMSRYNTLPATFGKLSKNGVPTASIIFISLLAMLAPWFGREVLNWIVDMCSVGISVAYGLTCFVAFRHSRVEKKSGMQVVSILGVLVSIGFLLILLVPGSPGFLSAPSLWCLLIWAVAGGAVYLKWVAGRSERTT